MTPYLIGAVAIVVLAGFAAAVWKLLGYLIYKPEPGKHTAPPPPSHRERRQAERDEDAENLKLIQGISNGLRGEATRATSPGMPRPEWPLQPLPPGVEEHADHFHRVLPPGEYYDPYGDSDEPAPHLTPQQIARLSGQPEVAHQDVEEGAGVPPGAAEPTDGRGSSDGRSVSPLPLDPYDVATPEQEADAYVGLEETSQPPGSESSGTLEGSSKPEPAPLTDYREETGSWATLVDAVVPKDGE